MKRAIFLVALALLAVLIASNTTYKQQTLIPLLQDLLPNKPFERFFSLFEISYWGRIISVEMSGYYHFLEFLIRKFTHFAGYGLIAVIMYYLYTKLHMRYKGRLAVASVFIIACLDEFRQTFLDGRTGTFKDVILDTVGAIVFISIVKLIMKIVQKK